MDVVGNNNDRDANVEQSTEPNQNNENTSQDTGCIDNVRDETEEAADIEQNIHINGLGVDNEINYIEGRRIVDMDNFLWQLKRISGHNNGNCHFDELKFRKEIRIGLHSKIILDCNSCNESFMLYTNDDAKTTATMCVNSSAVLGANMIGIGFTQLQQFTSILDVPTMCNDKFKSLNNVGKDWEDTAQEFMRRAAKEEELAAIARGDVDEDGIPFITVVVDGCWSKRSYNRNFTALSGVAAIIGAYTGKVLWIDVRNKYCVICVRHANKDLEPPPHLCTRNHTGPSSEMEWVGVLEGFKSSVEFYNLRYLKVISDGDSSTYAKLLEHKPYQDRHIVKIECTNHLHRNVYKAIEKAVKGCPRGLNKYVCSNLERIRKDISCAIQYRKNQDKTESEKISLLKSDLSNVLHHVFGDHTNCPEYIKKFCKDDKNYVPDLNKCDTFEKMSAAVRQLMYCAKDLILGETNNIAEHFNSIVAKCVGGKRVNFSLSNAYKYKANAAAVQYNARAPLSALYNFKFNTNPPALTTKIEQQRLRKSDREKERRRLMKANKIIRTPFCRVKQSGPGYGPDGQRPDLSEENFENEKEILIKKLNRYHETRISIEENTRSKEESSLWNEIVKIVILSKDFGPICKARVLAVHVKELTTRKFGETKAMKHENQSLPVARQQLAKQENLFIRECGICIDNENIFLAASPSGIVSDSDMIVEIQCPLAIINMDANDPKVLGKGISYLYSLLRDHSQITHASKKVGRFFKKHSKGEGG